jgi:hypothetical protein
VKKLSECRFSVHRADVVLEIEVDPHWALVELIEPVAGGEQGIHPGATESLEGIVSPAFRTVCRAPFLKLTARPSERPGVFRTIFRVPRGREASPSEQQGASPGLKK